MASIQTTAQTPAHLEKPSLDGFFITGTDTEIGKTFVSASIELSLAQAGYRVLPRKPIASGCIKQPDCSLVSEDALLLQQHSNSGLSLADICRYQFEAPISPQRAIANSHQNICISDLVDACQIHRSEADNSVTLVEGAGGFCSPLALDGLNADLATQLDLPIILVVGNRLGCINHALLTIEAIQHRGLCLHCVVVNDISAMADIDNLHDLRRLCQVPVLHNRYSADAKIQALAGFELTLST